MAPDFNARVAGEIRAEMARQNLTQQQLADMLELSQVAVSRRVSGVVKLSTHDIERFAGALGVPVDQLLAVPAAAVP